MGQEMKKARGTHWWSGDPLGPGGKWNLELKGEKGTQMVFSSPKSKHVSAPDLPVGHLWTRLGGWGERGGGWKVEGRRGGGTKKKREEEERRGGRGGNRQRRGPPQPGPSVGSRAWSEGWMSPCSLPHLISSSASQAPAGLQRRHSAITGKGSWEAFNQVYRLHPHFPL